MELRTGSRYTPGILAQADAISAPPGVGRIEDGNAVVPKAGGGTYRFEVDTDRRRDERYFYLSEEHGVLLRIAFLGEQHLNAKTVRVAVLKYAY